VTVTIGVVTATVVVVGVLTVTVATGVVTATVAGSVGTETVGSETVGSRSDDVVVGAGKGDVGDASFVEPCVDWGAVLGVEASRVLE
jgi:hypothetical protein